MIRVQINGEAAEIGVGTNLVDLVRRQTRDERGVAIAVNAEVVPRSDWEATFVTAGDRIEIVRAVQGG